jgi:hypothetical protein
MSSSKIKMAAALFYAAMAVNTFGHAAAESDVRYYACEANDVEWCGVRDSWLRGLVAAALWPLYWSWEIWS